MWRLFQYGTTVQDFCDRAQPALWEAMEDRLAMLMERGNAAREPVSERITGSDGLFALRANADNLQGRLIYFFGPELRQIIFVHAVVLKKVRRISRDDIEHAERKKKLVLADLGSVHAFRIH